MEVEVETQRTTERTTESAKSGILGPSAQVLKGQKGTGG